MDLVTISSNNSLKHTNSLSSVESDRNSTRSNRTSSSINMPQNKSGLSFRTKTEPVTDTQNTINQQIRNLINKKNIPEQKGGGFNDDVMPPSGIIIDPTVVKKLQDVVRRTNILMHGGKNDQTTSDNLSQFDDRTLSPTSDRSYTNSASSKRWTDNSRWNSSENLTSNRGIFSDNSYLSSRERFSEISTDSIPSSQRSETSEFENSLSNGKRSTENSKRFSDSLSQRRNTTDVSRTSNEAFAQPVGRQSLNTPSVTSSEIIESYNKTNSSSLQKKTR